MSSLVATRGFSVGAGVGSAGVGVGVDAGAGVWVLLFSCFASSSAVLTAAAMSASTFTGSGVVLVVGSAGGCGVSGVVGWVLASSLVEASMLPRSSSPFWSLSAFSVWMVRLVVVWRRRLIAWRLYSLVVMGWLFSSGLVVLLLWCV